MALYHCRMSHTYIRSFILTYFQLASIPICPIYSYNILLLLLKAQYNKTNTFTTQYYMVHTKLFSSSTLISVETKPEKSDNRFCDLKC